LFFRLTPGCAPVTLSPPSGLSASVDLAAVGAGDVAGDGEAEPGAALVLVARLVQPDERLEHFLALVHRHARAVVVDRQHEPASLHHGPHFDHHAWRSALVMRLTMSRRNASGRTVTTSGSPHRTVTSVALALGVTADLLERFHDVGRGGLLSPVSPRAKAR
jgi:hypothetical protein